MTRIAFAAPVALLLTLSLAASGCAGERSGVGARCSTNDDCRSGTVCSGSFCVVSGGGSVADLAGGGGGGDGGGGGGARDGGGTGSDADARLCAKVSFKLSDTQVAFKVPLTALYMHVKAWGAGGNGEGGCGRPDDGGPGGYSEAAFEVGSAKAVAPGDELIVIVGKRGRAGMTGEERVRFGFGDWGGGGLSGVFSAGSPIDKNSAGRALVVAGGGGSAGAPGCHPGGPGNHPKAGGQTSMQGGPGADKVNGGGGGYHGGSGGAKGEAARGGSGFVASSAQGTRVLHAQLGDTSPPNTGDADYDGQAGKTEKSGQVVVHFRCTLPSI